MITNGKFVDTRMVLLIPQNFAITPPTRKFTSLVDMDYIYFVIFLDSFTFLVLFVDNGESV